MLFYKYIFVLYLHFPWKVIFNSYRIYVCQSWALYVKFRFIITSFRHTRFPFKKDDAEKRSADHFRWTLAVGHCQSLWDPVVDGHNLERCKRFHSDLPRTLCYDVAWSKCVSRLRWRNCTTTKQEPQEGIPHAWLFMNYASFCPSFLTTFFLYVWDILKY